MIKVDFKNVTKTFEGGIEVLKGICLQLHNGESHIILGQSGCGKSVLMKCLLGIIPITSGDIVVDGISVLDKKQRRQYMRKFSVLFQGGALFDSMTVLENVEFALNQINHDAKACRSIAEEKLIAVGLDQNIFTRYPAEISGGMQKRAALARALAMAPEVIIFDEPTSGLDPITGGVVCNLLKDTIAGTGITAITITHDLKVAEFLADRVSVLNKGHIEWTGKESEMSRCGNEFVERFFRASKGITNHRK